MNPLVFQMNIMQVATLLQSLHLNYENGNNTPLDLAVDTWSQLSDYAKGRIQEVFCKRDPKFSKFIDQVDEDAQNPEYRYMTESEVMEKGEASRDEMLLIADKGSMVCNLTLSQPLRSRKNQRIFYDHDQNSYYAVPAENTSAKPLYFSVEEVRDISES